MTRLWLGSAAPYLLDHVAAVVSRIQATPIEPSKHKQFSASISAAPTLPPSIAKSPANSDGGESVGHDDEEDGASSGKDDEDLKDEFYSMLGLLPPNRLTKFIDQMRRNALTLCASMLEAWNVHSWERKRMLEVCGRCLKRTLARSFVRVSPSHELENAWCSLRLSPVTTVPSCTFPRALTRSCTRSIYWD